MWKFFKLQISADIRVTIKLIRKNFVQVKEPFVKSTLVSFVPMPSPGEIAKTNDPAIVSGFGTLTVISIDMTMNFINGNYDIYNF